MTFLGQLIAVTRNAFVESIRQPFYVVWLLTVIILNVLAPHLSAYTFEDDNAFAAEMMLSVLMMGGLILAAFTAAGVISREIENRTVLTVISKPIPRPIFIIGKYFGIAGALVLAWWNWAFIGLITLRQGAFSTGSTPWDMPVLVFGFLGLAISVAIASIGNYLFHKHFGATLAKWMALILPIAYLAILPFDHDFHPQRFAEDVRWPVYMAQFLVLQSIFLFAAVATACSTRLGQVATLAICLVVFLLGIASDFYLGRLATTVIEDGRIVREGALWAKWLYAVVPNLGFHWLADALTGGTARNMTMTYFASVSAYTVLFVVGILGLAVALFQTRETA